MFFNYHSIEISYKSKKQGTKIPNPIKIAPDNINGSIETGIGSET